MKFHLISPLRVAISKNKDFILNMNNYRNTHYQSLNKAKVNYKDVMEFYIQFMPKFTPPVKVTYVIYPASRRKGDGMNVASVQSKFFLDALVKADKLPDDDWHNVSSETWEFGWVDKNNPRIEITVEEISNV